MEFCYSLRGHYCTDNTSNHNIKGHQSSFLNICFNEKSRTESFTIFQLLKYIYLININIVGKQLTKVHLKAEPRDCPSDAVLYSRPAECFT